MLVIAILTPGPQNIHYRNNHNRLLAVHNLDTGNTRSALTSDDCAATGGSLPVTYQPSTTVTPSFSVPGDTLLFSGVHLDLNVLLL